MSLIHHSLLIFCFFLSTSLADLAHGSWQTKDHCDIPSESIKNVKSSSEMECQQTCEANRDCRAYVYVTGWQRCFLKARSNQDMKIRLISAGMQQGEKRSFNLKVDHDHSGKDLERLVLSKAEECGQACEARSDCQAFTYIEGYRVCWLKAGGGILKPKVFHCGLRKP